MWFQLAARNLTRNARRTLLSMTIVALGVIALYFITGFIDATRVEWKQFIVDQQTGNIQIAAPAFWDQEFDDYDYLVAPETVERVVAMLAEYDEVTAHTTQLMMMGMASNGRKTQMMEGVAWTPGNAALDYNDLVVEGDELQPDDRSRVLIGRTFADVLNLAPGDRFRVTTTTAAGAYNLGTLQVAGVYSLNDADQESKVVFMTLPAAQSLLDTAGVAKIVVTLANLDATERVASAIEADLDDAGLGLEGRTWLEIADYFRQVLDMLGFMGGFIALAVGVLVFFIVLQVLVMAFLERTREVGTIRAIGTRRRQVFGLFLIEGTVLGLLGGLLGVGAGWALGQGFNALDIQWTPPGFLDPTPVDLRLTLANAGVPFVVATVATIVSTAFPASRMTRLTIVDALRTS